MNGMDLQIFAGESGAGNPGDPAAGMRNGAESNDGGARTAGALAGGPAAGGRNGQARSLRDASEQERYRAAQGREEDACTAGELAGGPAAGGRNGQACSLRGDGFPQSRPEGRDSSPYEGEPGDRGKNGQARSLRGDGAESNDGDARIAGALREHFRRLEGEAEQMREVFPGFDLKRELRDPRFAALTAPGMGVSVEDAYYALHRRELQAASMQVAAQRAAQKLASSIQSAARRPVENGAGSASPAGLGTQGMTRQQREQLRQRIHNAAALGEKIYP